MDLREPCLRRDACAVALIALAVAVGDGCYASHELDDVGEAHGGTPLPGVPGVPHDVDGDGRPDLLVGAMEPAAVYVYAGTPDGLTTRPIATLPAGDYLGQLAFAGDLDHDGYAEIAIESRDVRGRVDREIFRGGRSGPSARASLALTLPDGYGVRDTYLASDTGYTSADVDGDGWQDLVVASSQIDGTTGRATSRALAVYLGRDGAVPTVPTHVAIVPARDGRATSGTLSVASVGDVDGDGREDVALLVPEGDWGSAYLFLGAPDGAWAAPLTLALGEAIHFVAPLGDVDGDGLDDFTAGSLYFRGAPGGAAPFDRHALRPVLSEAFLWTAAGDVDGDGYDDVLSSELDRASSTSSLVLHFGGPGGVDASPARPPVAYAFGASQAFTALGDADGDGLADFVAAYDGALHVALGRDARGTWSQTVADPVATGYRVFGYVID